MWRRLFSYLNLWEPEPQLKYQSVGHKDVEQSDECYHSTESATSQRLSWGQGHMIWPALPQDHRGSDQHLSHRMELGR